MTNEMQQSNQELQRLRVDEVRRRSLQKRLDAARFEGGVDGQVMNLVMVFIVGTVFSHRNFSLKWFSSGTQIGFRFQVWISIGERKKGSCNLRTFCSGS